MELPNSAEEAFDLATEEIHPWELDFIHEALLHEKIEFEPHAVDAAQDDGIPLVDILSVILVGTAISKDLPGNVFGRKVGINYEGNISDGRSIRVKVSWFSGYAIITVHTI